MISSWMALLFAGHLTVAAQPVEVSWEALKDRADSAFEEKQWVEAQRQYRAAIKLANSANASSPQLADLHNQLGRALYEDDQLTSAERTYRRGLSLHQRGGSAESADAAAIWFNLGHVLDGQKRPKDAEAAYLRCAEIEREVLGADSLELAVTLAQLGGFHAGKENFEQAEPHYAEAAAIRQQHADPAAAVSFKDWAINRYRLSDYPRAIELANQAIALADHSSDVAGLSYNVIAMSHEAQGDYVNAAVHYRYALRLLREALGYQSENFKTVASNYADLAIDHDPAWATEAPE